MAKNDEALIRRAEKARAKAAELLRVAQRAESALSERGRKEDTRRKILAGSWALDKAEKSPEFAADMQRDLNRFWLVRDDDRKLYNLTPLTTEEKTARGVSPLGSDSRKAKPSLADERQRIKAQEPQLRSQLEDA